MEKSKSNLSMLSQVPLLTFTLKIMLKNLDLVSIIMRKYQNKKKELTWKKELFVVKKVKYTVPGTNVINNFNGKDVTEIFTKKCCKKQIKRKLGLKKWFGKKKINSMSIWRAMINNKLIKKIYYKDKTVPKLWWKCGSWVWIICTTVDRKRATGFHTTKLETKFDLAGLKAQVDKSKVNKLEAVSPDLSEVI